MNLFKLPDRRNLAWHEWGAPRGRTLVFCPGAGMAGALLFGERQALQLGIRIISVDRPGLGGSDPDPGKTLSSWAADIRQLLDHLDAAPAAALGFSQGAPFAFALAAGGVAHSVTIVSGQDELAFPSIIAQLPEAVVRMVRRADSDMAAMQAELAAGATAEWLWQMIATMSSKEDRAFYESDDIAMIVRASLAAGFRQGGAGYARDTVLAMAPWPFRVEMLDCPVRLWFGLQDSSPVHSPDFGRTLAARIRSARLTQIATEGSAILWTHAGEILAAASPMP